MCISAFRCVSSANCVVVLIGTARKGGLSCSKTVPFAGLECATAVSISAFRCFYTVPTVWFCLCFSHSLTTAHWCFLCRPPADEPYRSATATLSVYRRPRTAGRGSERRQSVWASSSRCTLPPGTLNQHGTNKEMMQPCLAYAHVMSLVAGIGRGVHACMGWFADLRVPGERCRSLKARTFHWPFTALPLPFR